MTTFRRVDMVQVVTATAGTGNLTFGAAVPGYIDVATAIARGKLATGETVFYVIVDPGFRETGFAAISGDGATLLRAAATDVESTLAVASDKIDCAGGGLTRIFMAVPDVEKLTQQDRGSEGGTLAETDVDNNFSTGQSITGTLTVTGAIVLTGDQTTSGASAVNGGAVNVKKTDSGVNGVVEDAFHDSASPAASDIPYLKTFSGRSSTGVKRSYADEHVEIVTTTNGAEDGRRIFRVAQGGSLTEVLNIGPDGVSVGGAAPQGPGTFAIPTGFYIGGALQTAQTRQALMGEDSNVFFSGVGTFLTDFGTTLRYNSIAGASWNNSTDTLSLPAGKYHAIIRADVIFTAVTSISFRVRDVTNNVTLQPGANSFTMSAARFMVEFFDFELTGAADVQFQWTTSGSSGTGSADRVFVEIVRVG